MLEYEECLELTNYVNVLIETYEQKCNTNRLVKWLCCIKGDLAARAKDALKRDKQQERGEAGA